MNADVWVGRERRAIDMHPTPVEIHTAILDAILDHDKTADPRDRFPVCAHGVIREAIRKCTAEHAARVQNTWPENNHAR